MDQLADELVERLSALPPADLALNQVILPNGFDAQSFLALFPETSGAESFPTGPQDKRNQLIAKMSQAAIRLTTRSLWMAPDEGPGLPAQPNGLAYVYGSKQTDVRRVSSSGCCASLYGLDCSGFLYQVFFAAGVNLPQGNADNQSKVATLDAALTASSQYAELYSQDLGVLGHTEMMSGDVLYWKDAAGVTQHIGIVLEDSTGGLSVFQSNGTTGKKNGRCSPEECAKNQGPGRGPRTFALSAAHTFFVNSGYRLGGVVRLLASLSGEWNFRLRCAGATFDVVDAAIQFPPNATSSFALNQRFLDYNGQPLTGQFDFNYDPVHNVLSCRFDISSAACQQNPFRTEEFEVRLDRDDTGYVPTTEVFRNQCAGCRVEVRLINARGSGADGLDPLLKLLLADEHWDQLGPR